MESKCIALLVVIILFSEAATSVGHGSIKQGVLKNLAKFTGKHLCQSLFFNKVAG